MTQRHLYVARADGTATTQLTYGPVADGSPEWLPELSVVRR
jgi:hypothetical protein